MSDFEPKNSVDSSELTVSKIPLIQQVADYTGQYYYQDSRGQIRLKPEYDTHGEGVQFGSPTHIAYKVVLVYKYLLHRAQGGDDESWAKGSFTKIRTLYDSNLDLTVFKVVDPKGDSELPDYYFYSNGTNKLEDGGMDGVVEAHGEKFQVIDEGGELKVVPFTES